MPFEQGHSGNPDGRPKGARNRATRAAEQLLDGEADTLTRKAIELAKQGDTTALRLCIERILPTRKDRPVSFDMPPIETVADSVRAAAAIATAVAEGELTPMEAAELSKVVDGYTRAVETADLAARLSRLEQALKKSGTMMPNALEARLTRLETRSDQASRKFIVVANEAERDALARTGGIPAGAVIIVTGVPRSSSK